MIQWTCYDSMNMLWNIGSASSMNMLWNIGSASMNMLWKIGSASLVSLSDNGGEFIGDDFYMCGKF